MCVSFVHVCACLIFSPWHLCPSRPDHVSGREARANDLQVWTLLAFAKTSWLSATSLFPLVFLHSLANLPVTFQVSPLPGLGGSGQGSLRFVVLQAPKETCAGDLHG